MPRGVSAIPRIEVDLTAVATNTTWVGPVRGAGRPEATQMLERAMDMFAAESGMDPAGVRRRNFVPADAACAHTTAVGTTYDIGDYAGALELALERAGYEQLRRDQEQRRSQRAVRQLGIGLS